MRLLYRLLKVTCEKKKKKTSGFVVSQHGIRAKVNDYLRSSVGVVISLVRIPASQYDIRAKVSDYL